MAASTAMDCSTFRSSIPPEPTGTSTANWQAVWDAVDAAPDGTTGSLGGFNVVNNTKDTETVFNYGDDRGNFDPTNDVDTIAGDGPGGGPGPFSGGDNFSVRAQTYLRFDTAGTYSIALGSDDGRVIRLTEATVGSAPGYAGFTQQGDQFNGAFTAGDTEVGFDGGTGHNQTVGVFDVGAGDVLFLEAFYYEGGGGSSGEIMIQQGTDTSVSGGNNSDPQAFNDGWRLLENGIFGISLDSTNNFQANTDTATLTVTISGGANSAPVVPDPGAQMIAEDAAINALVVDIDATDGEGGAADQNVTYDIISGNVGGAFSINVNTGEITVASALDFETTPSYTLTVEADDGGLQTTRDITINVTNVDEAPTIVSSDSVMVAENSTAVVDVNASDPEGETENGGGLTYRISGGVDQALFDIDTDTGALSFVSGRDFENPTDDGTNNVYNVQVEVSDGVNQSTQNIAVTVTNVDEAPSIISANTAMVAEGATAVLDVNASDPEGETENGGGLTYRISGGVDQALFDIDTDTGALSFVSGRDFENPTDDGANNVYNVQVEVSDGDNQSTQEIAVTVTNVDEPPVIPNPGAQSVSEGAAVNDLVVDLAGNDGDGGAPDANITYQITAGNVGSAFSIDTNTGEITVAGPLDFETTPSYTLTVEADDGVNQSTEDIVINVTNQDPDIQVEGLSMTVIADGDVTPTEADGSDFGGVETVDGLRTRTFTIRNNGQDTLTLAAIAITGAARTKAQTGVEMESLTAVSVAALTIYDMCKAIDKEMEIGEVKLVRKTKEEI